jgi:hypothetical protein
MITPKLEELILCGKAEYKTFGCAFSSNYKMPIPDNCILVVTDIIWNNFLQAPLQTNPMLEDWADFNAVQLRFYDPTRKYYHLHIRNSMKLINNANNNFNTNQPISVAIGNRALVMPEPPQQFHVFFVHKKLLEINLIMMEKPENFVFNTGTIVDAPGLLDPVPIDTGDTLNTVTRSVSTPAGDNIENFPQGLDFTPAPAPGIYAANEFIELNHQRYQLQAPLAQFLPNSSSPLFTVGYVLIRDKEIFSTLSDK